jgi:transmembrane protein EpsG
MAWIHPALLRITMYFSIFIILLIPEIIQNFQQYSFKLRRGLTVISVGILFVLFIKNNYSNDKSEYRFFWEEVKLGKNYE